MVSLVIFGTSVYWKYFVPYFSFRKTLYKLNETSCWIASLNVKIFFMFLEVYTCVYRRDQVKKRWKDWSLIFAVQESFHNHLILEWKYFADWYSTSILHIHLKFTLLPQVLHRIFHNITYNLELNFRGWHYADDTSLYIYSNTHISFLCENADIMRQCFIQVSRVFFNEILCMRRGNIFELFSDLISKACVTLLHVSKQ